MISRIAITTGDVDGIGLEVAIKALRAIKNWRGCELLLFVHTTTPTRLLRWAQAQLKKLPLTTISSSLEEALRAPPRAGKLQMIFSDESPARWVEQCAWACLKSELQAMSTGPLSKPLIKSAGLADLGHTDILKRVCTQHTGQKHRAFMGFIGRHFNVVLATGHIPLSQVERALTEETLLAACSAAESFRPLLDAKRKRLPLGLLGLNPHAGDQGLIGEFENKNFPRVLKKLKIQALGPLIPDVAFQAPQQKKFSFYIAAYHDQGLIPFKLAHGFAGVHITLGLPIHRTSVDHGTAQDIFGKDLANPDSMIDAIQWAIKLGRRPHTVSGNRRSAHV